MSDYPVNFQLFNDLQTKEVAIVVKVDGVDDLITSTPVYTKLRYGDPGLKYGDPGLVYGGLRRVDGARDILSFDGASLTISQRIEPEQGRGSISMLTLALIDKDQWATQLITRGGLTPEIMGRYVEIFLGYKQTSYPEDYFRVFRGKVTSVSAQGGNITLQVSDPNFKKKQKIFYSSVSSLSSAIDAAVTTIPVISNADFHQQILGPNGGYDPAIKTYIKIDDEIIEYPTTGFGTNQFTSCVRGARGTIAATHDSGTEVAACIQIEDHGIDMALKLMLSGFNGFWKEDVSIKNLVFTAELPTPYMSNAIILPEKVDAVRDYGLVAGDYITLSGCTNGANNKTVTIISFKNLFDENNRVILCSESFIQEIDSPGKMAFRSQYDTYPVGCGAGLTPQDVDINAHLYLKRTFLYAYNNRYRFFITEQEEAKGFIESQLMLTMSSYSVTRFGKVSMVYTKPPYGDQRMVILDKNNIIEPEKIRTSRSLNDRRFFNEVDWDWDYDDNGEAKMLSRHAAGDSISLIDMEFPLPIHAKGARSEFDFQNISRKRSSSILSRYKWGGKVLPLKVMFGIAATVETGDIVAVKDEGNLQIVDFETGERNLGVQLFEVIERLLDLKTGQGQLVLLGGIGGSTLDRYATVAPSSLIALVGTVNKFKIKDSFGAFYPGDEPRKWQDYFGLRIRVHSADYTRDAETVLLRFANGDRYTLLVSPDLPFVPQPNDIVDLAPYPLNSSKTDQQLVKQIHCYLTPCVKVVTGIDDKTFTVAPADVYKFQPGFPVRIHNADYSIKSDFDTEPVVDTVVGSTITLKTSMGFVPDNTFFVDGLGFPDGGGPYRMV